MPKRKREFDFCADNLSECSDYSNTGYDSDSLSDSIDIHWEKIETASVSSGGVEEVDENVPFEEINSWSSIDELPALQPFLGGPPGLKIKPEDPKKISDVVSLFIGDDLFQHFVGESNQYHARNFAKDTAPRSCKWTDITVSEMKKFLGLILIMGIVRKDCNSAYWSTDLLTETPFFSKTITRNRYKQIWQTWHFSNNENISEDSDRLEKIKPVVDYFTNKFRTVYIPDRNLSVDERIIPWRGQLSFRLCDRDATKYGLYVREISDSLTGYICNLKIYTSKNIASNEYLDSLFEPYLGIGHHLYMNDADVLLAETLLLSNTQICAKIQEKNIIPTKLKNAKLAKKKSIFQRKGDVLIQIWNNDHQNFNIISTIHSAETKNTRYFNNKLQLYAHKPISMIDYAIYTKYVDKPDKQAAYNTKFLHTSKWSKRVVFFLLNYALYNSYVIYKHLNGKTMKYKEFIHTVARSWIASPELLEIKEEEISTSCDAPTRRAPKEDNPDRIIPELKKHKLEKIVSSSEKKKLDAELAEFASSTEDGAIPIIIAHFASFHCIEAIVLSATTA